MSEIKTPVEGQDIRIPMQGVYPISQLHNYAIQAARCEGLADVNIRTRQTSQTFRIILERRQRFSDKFGRGIYGFPAAVIEVPAVEYGHAGNGDAVVSKNLDRFDFEYPFLGLSLADAELERYAHFFSQLLNRHDITEA